MMKSHVKRVSGRIKRKIKDEKLSPIRVAKHNAKADTNTNEYANNHKKC